MIAIAVSARPLKDAEDDGTLSELYYGRSPLALVTFNDVGIDNLSQADILSIYRQETIHWPAGDPIRFVMRASSETDSKLLVSFADGLSDANEAQRMKVGGPTVYVYQEKVELLS